MALLYWFCRLFALKFAKIRIINLALVMAKHLALKEKMLSIIIPTLNEEKHLPLLLDSIKNQSFKDYEIIVADAGSKDNTVKIAKDYGCRIVKGGLLPFGRNSGARQAQAETLLFMDADIIMRHENFLENALKIFYGKNLGLAVFPLKPITKNIFYKITFYFWNKWMRLTQVIFPHGASVFLVKKSAHESVGGFDEGIVFVE